MAGQAGDFLEGARLGEEVGGAGDDLELAVAAELIVRLAVELQDDLVGATDDQQGGRLTFCSAPAARSGRPPRETTAPTESGDRPAARSAAPAPVLAPK